MRRLLFLSVLCFLCGSAWAQQIAVSGKVSDAQGAPVPGATVTEKGTTNATAADDNGNFRIVVSNGAILTINAIGFAAEEVPARANVTVSLEGSNQVMDEVVVTALGIRRSKNALPYAAQQVKGEDLSRIRSNNAAAALSGKVSGLEIRQGNGISGSTNIVIRGTKSLTDNNQALFVVDGVPVDNSNTNTQDQKTGRGGYDYGNAAADINPDDIESINVLKGAAASALYGSRAANGVIMITTKKGKRGLGVTINSGVTWSNIDKSTFPKYQKSYGAGYVPGFFSFDVDGDGVDDDVVQTSEDASYGPAFDPDKLVYHWDAFDPAGPNYLKPKPWVAADNDPSTFYETGISTNNNILIQAGGENTSVKLGYTRNDEKGVLPNSRVVKNIVNFGITHNLNDKLSVSSNINYSRIDGLGRYGTGYSGLNPNQNFRQWYETNVDIQEQKEAFFRNGLNVTWNWADPSTPEGTRPKYTDNYYWTRYKNFQTDMRNRIFGNVTGNYKIFDWLNLMGRVTVDNYSEFQDERIAVGSVDIPYYSRFDRTFNETNLDLIATAAKELGTNFMLNALVGVNQRKTTVGSTFSETSGGLVIPEFYAISNSAGPVPPAVETYQPERVDGYFGGLTLTYNEFLTLDGTIRRDRSSTLPADNNAYNYYSIAGSWVFSKHLQTLPWLSLGKLRLNYATVGNDAPWGSTLDVFTPVQAFGNTVQYTLPSSKNNVNLRPEQTTSREAGIELALFDGRLGLDATYYKSNTVDQIIPVSVSTATGYSSKYLNAGDVQNQGIELSLNATPVRTPDISWTINVNWTRNRNLVVSLYDTSKNLQLATAQGGISINASLGQPYGTIQGRAIEKLNGQNLIDADGYYVTTSNTTNVIGNVNPDWIGGIYNTIRFRNISLGFLIDMRKGGDLFSLDRFYSQYTGATADYVYLNDLGNPVRSPIEEGGGRILQGVTEDGKPNTTRVDANFANLTGATIPPSEYIYDASYIKLREATLTYSLPVALVERTRSFKAIDISLIGRNLWILHKNVPYADPEENLSSGNVQGIQSGAYPTARYMGFNVKLSF